MNNSNNKNKKATATKRTVESENCLEHNFGHKYKNPEEALVLAHDIAMKATLDGYFVSTSACLQANVVEVTVYLGEKDIPRYSSCDKCTDRALRTQEYWDEKECIRKEACFVDYCFEIVAS